MEENKAEKKDQEIRVDQKYKILFVVIGILVAGSVAATFWRYIVKRDYVIQSQIDCDPETEECFVWECDPQSTEEGEACTGVPDNDIWYYKIFSRNAKNIPDCDPSDENCLAYICEEGEKDCSEELCTPENVPEGEECNNPEQYLLENYQEECEEGDEECLTEEEVIECEEGDEECLLEAENTECDPKSEDCEEAAVDEEASETEDQDIPSEENSSEVAPGSQNIPPPGVEPN